MYENDTMRPVEIVLRREEGIKGKMEEVTLTRYIVSTFVNIACTLCTTIVC
jgi:hypothetical protein